MRSSRASFGLFFVLGSVLLWAKSAHPPVYRNTGPEVAYGGSKSCTGSRCHDAICRTYPQTPMGRSMAPANLPSEFQKVPKLIAVFSRKLSRYFESAPTLTRANTRSAKNGRPVFKATHRLDCAIGAGMNGFTYVIRQGQYLFEAPLSCYSKEHHWDLSPGYEAADREMTKCYQASDGRLNCLPCQKIHDPPTSTNRAA